MINIDVNEKYFSKINSRERAIFEGAISMGALFHQFIGTPINSDSAESLEIAIKKSIELQPGIEKVEIAINKEKLNKKLSDFEYIGLSEDLLDVKIHSKINDALAIVRMEFIKELNYPLMYIEDIIQK